MRRLLLGAGLLLASLVAWADVPPIPALTARVTDLTATLSGDQRQHLEQQLAALEAKSGAQLAVLLVPTTGDDSIEEYAVRTFEKWKLGQKKVDDGVLLLVAKNDRTLRIEVGYGLEGAITDVQAGRIISEQITPQFRQGNFYGGIQAGVDSLVQLIDAEKNPDSATASAPVDALPAVPEATPPRALPAPVDEGEVYDSAPPEPKKKSGLSGQLWGNPVYLGGGPARRGPARTPAAVAVDAAAQHRPLPALQRGGRRPGLAVEHGPVAERRPRGGRQSRRTGADPVHLRPVPASRRSADGHPQRHPQ